MALYAFDGTGNEDEDFDTNTLEFFRAFQDPLKNDDPQTSHGSLYLKGIGTRARTRSGDVLAQNRSDADQLAIVTYCTPPFNWGQVSPGVRITIRRTPSAASTTQA